jgi:uncharacterized MAPEG superfamily protein
MPELALFSPIVSLVLFAVWPLLLVMCVGLWRLALGSTGQMPAGGFPAGTPHGSDGYWRLNRAHLNTVENLPIFGALVLAGLHLQLADPLFQTLTNVVVLARVGQTLTHLTSTAFAMVLVRFSFYVVQVLSMLGIAGLCLSAAGFSLVS